MQYSGINLYPSKDYTVCNRSILFQNEFWKDVVGYEGSYIISSLGRVKSLKRIIPRKTGFHTKPEKHLRRYNNGNGYLTILLYNNLGNKRFYIHRLLLLCFKENSNLVVDHKNHIKSDNRLINLRYLTQRDNTSNRKYNKTPFIGVYFCKRDNTYKAVIKLEGETYLLGSGSNPQELSDRYLKAKENWLLDGSKPYIRRTFNRVNKPKRIKEIKIFKSPNAKIVFDSETGIYYNSLRELTDLNKLDYKLTSQKIIQNKSRYQYT